MCVVSMVGDHYHDYFTKKPWWPEANEKQTIVFNPGISRQEFDELKKEVEMMKELLKRAIQYDIDNDEPHCEVEEKIATLKKVAEAVGISLDDILIEKKS